jgi:hypothetical protein
MEATAEMTTVTAVNSKRNFTISILILSQVSGFTLRAKPAESSMGIRVLLSSQHSSRASYNRTCRPKCPENSSLLRLEIIPTVALDL